MIRSRLSPNARISVSACRALVRQIGFALAILTLLALPARAQPVDVGVAGTGAVKFGAAAVACDAAMEGSIRYDDTNNRIDLCDDTVWIAINGGAGDNLGNHTATTNIQLGTNWLSGDGGNEGIFVGSTGNVGIGTNNPTRAFSVAGPQTAQADFFYDNADVADTDDGQKVVVWRRAAEDDSAVRLYVDQYKEFYLYGDASTAHMHIGTDGWAGKVFLQDNNPGGVSMFDQSQSGVTPPLSIGGFRTGDSLRFMTIAVGVDAANTASFYDIGNYYFNGNVGVGAVAPAANFDAGKSVGFSGDLSPASLGASQNNYNPANLATASVLRLTASTPVNITGLQGGADGRILTVVNTGANAITLVDESASSTAANRFALTGNLALATDQSAILIYDSTTSRWRQIANGTATGSGDNLGNHTATQNIVLGTNFLSGDGGNEGIQVGTTGIVTIGTTLIGAGNDANVNMQDDGFGNLFLTSLDSAGKIFMTPGVSNSTGYSLLTVNGFTEGVGIGWGNVDPAATLDVDGSVALRNDLSPPSLGASQNNYNPTDLAYAAVLRLTASTPVNITGLQGGADGRILTLVNVGANAITLVDESASSTAANRFALTGNLALATDQSAILMYDSTTLRWRQIALGSATGAGDNLGNHTATANVRLGSNWLSGDGGNEGLTVDTSGNATASGNLGISGNATVTGTLGVTGNTTLTGNLSVTNNTTLTGTLGVTSATTLSNAVSFAGDLSPASLGASQNDYNPANLSTASVLRLTASTPVNITGLQGGADGRILTLVNTGANAITLVDESASSTAANRFALTGNLALATDQSAILIYDSTTSRWRQIANGTATGSGDNLGNHTTTQNVILGTNYISRTGAASTGLYFSADTVPVFSATDAATTLTVENNNSTVARYPGLYVKNYMGTPNSGAPIVNLFNARGNVSSASPVQTWDTLGMVAGNGQKSSGAFAQGTGAVISFLATENWTTSATGGRIEFGTTPNGSNAWPTTRMVIDDGGEVGIGNTSPSVALDVTGDIEYTGTITDVSDIRLKTDIKALDTNDIISKLAQVDTYSFRMKDDAKGQLEYGVIAQEVEKIFPDLVRTDDSEDHYKSVNYVGFIAPLIEAVKELKADNDNLRVQLQSANERHADQLEELRADIKGLKAYTGYGIGKAGFGLGVLAALGIAGASFCLSRRRKSAA